MTVGRFVTPTGVVIRMDAKAARSVGYQPEKPAPKRRRKADQADEQQD